MKFFIGKCGTVVTKLFEKECEGGPLEELIPNTTDAAGEKHVPKEIAAVIPPLLIEADL